MEEKLEAEKKEVADKLRQEKQDLLDKRRKQEDEVKRLHLRKILMQFVRDAVPDQGRSQEGGRETLS